MIGFQLQNGDVVTARVTQSVEFELNSTVLENELILGSHSLEVSIDDVDGNMIKLEAANRQDKLSRNTIFDDVLLLLLGLKEYKGKLVLRRIRETGVDAFMIINGFSIEILNMLLNEIDYGNDVSLGSTPAAITSAAAGYVTQNYPDVNFNFPTIYAPNFYKGKALGWQSPDTAERFDDEQEYALRAVVLWTDGYCYVCVDGTSAGESPSTHPAKWQILVSNGLLNNWIDSSSEFHYNNQTYLYTQNAHALAPQLFDKFVLKQLESTIGYRITGEFINDVLTDQSMLITTRALDKLPTPVIVKIENDGVYSATTNTSVAGGNIVMNGVGVQSVWRHLHFNNVITDPNSDWTVVNPSPGTDIPPSYYTIHSEGIHRFYFNIDLAVNNGVAHTVGGVTTPNRIIVYVDGVNRGEVSFADSPWTGVITGAVEWFAPAGNIGSVVSFRMLDGSGSGLTDAPFEYAPGSFVQIENLSTNQYNEWDGTVHHADHVPDKTVRDYLLSLKNRFNLSIKLDFFEKEIRMNYATSILEREAVDMTDIIQEMESDVQEPQGCTIAESPSSGIDHSDGSEYTVAATFNTYADMTDAIDDHNINDVVVVTAQFAYYILGQNNYDGAVEWQFLASKLPPLVYGNGARNITMFDQPAQMAYVNNDSERLLVPWVNNPGNTVLFGAEKEDMPIIHAFWHGLQDDESGTDQYPFASSAIYDAGGAEIGNMDLRFVEDLDESVWELLYKEWIRRVDLSLSFEADAFINYKEIFQLDFESPIRKRFTKYIMSRVLFEVDQQGRIDAEIQGIKIQP